MVFYNLLPEQIGHRASELPLNPIMVSDSCLSQRANGHFNSSKGDNWYSIRHTAASEILMLNPKSNRESWGWAYGTEPRKPPPGIPLACLVRV